VLADKTKVVDPVNLRHPDFGRLAIKIGRAIGCEKEAIEALEAAENDKSAFCLENNLWGSAIYEYVQERGELIGDAKTILDRLRESDRHLPEHKTPRGLGRDIAGTIIHLRKVMDVRLTEGRGRKIFYAFRDLSGAANN